MTDVPGTIPPGWEGLLDPGERVLWQGRPMQGISFAPVQPMQIVMGLFFMGFSTFWMIMASSIVGKMSGPVGIFPLFGLIFFGIGAYNAFGYAFWRAFVRSRSTYTLTTRRAFIARDLPVAGKSLQSYPITAQSPLEFVDGEPGTIFFASKHVSTQNGSLKSRIGFERIPDARAVYSQLRAVQRGEA